MKPSRSIFRRAASGCWAPGTYDIDAGDGEGPLRVAVFDGTAQFAGAGGDRRIERGQVAVLTESEAADAASIEPADGG